MFNTNHSRRNNGLAIVALIGAVCIATVTAARAVPMANHPLQAGALVPLASVEGINLGSVTADGDCLMVNTNVHGPDRPAHQVKRLTCVQ